jgi:Domain of unknown function (DUF5753)
LRLWSPVLVPGLVQTAEYAGALFLAAGADSDTADELVVIRMGRQAILDRPDPPHVVAVLDETVLAHLADMSERPNVSVQVIPAQTGANAGLSGAFDLASGDGGPEVLRMEAVEDVTAETRSLVRRAANNFVRVQADALPRAASRALILEVAEQWKAR